MSSQMKPQRFVQLDPATPLQVLTATARGMIDNHFIRAAQRAHTELMTAVAEAGRMGEVRSRISLCPATSPACCSATTWPRSRANAGSPRWR
jgi:hypothetical protein